MRLVLWIGAAICVARWFVPATHVSFSGSYQAVAHLFVGGLIGAAIANKRRRWDLATIAGLMTAIELAAAIITRM